MLNSKLQIGWVLGVILVLAFFRLLPHPPNATPIVTMALFAGAYFSNRFFACSIPLAAMLLSDIIIGFHVTLPYVYIGMIAAVFIGGALKKLSSVRLGVSVLLSSSIFFLITNFGAWLHHDLYPHSVTGLQQAYVAGLPFFRNAIIANFIFSYIVFYSFSRMTKVFASTRNIQPL